jgi:hypothetical protein
MGSKGHIWGRLLRGAAIVGAGVMALAAVAAAQDFRDYRDQSHNDGDWYGGGRENVSQEDDQESYGRRGDNQDDGGGRSRGGGRHLRNPRCQELERQLVRDWRGGSRDERRRIDDDLRAADRAYQKAKSEVEREDCYEDMFIFGRSLRHTPRCQRLDRQVEQAHQRLMQLQHRRDAYGDPDSRRVRQEDLVAELARNGCGENYARQYEANQARRRSSSLFSFWDDEGAPPPVDNGPAPVMTAPFGSYRTMCVRLCDGYFFPISYSTLPSHFKDDEARCKNQCSAQAELYIYRNPGEDLEQMVSLNGRRYTALPNAFRHRKQYIKGCSCKASEYSIEEITKSEKTLKKAALSRRSSSRTASHGTKAAREDAAGQGQ